MNDYFSFLLVIFPAVFFIVDPLGLLSIFVAITTNDPGDAIKDNRFKYAWMFDKAQFMAITASVFCNDACMVDDDDNMVLDDLVIDLEYMGYV